LASRASFSLSAVVTCFVLLLTVTSYDLEYGYPRSGTGREGKHPFRFLRGITIAHLGPMAGRRRLASDCTTLGHGKSSPRLFLKDDNCACLLIGVRVPTTLRLFLLPVLRRSSSPRPHVSSREGWFHIPNALAHVGRDEMFCDVVSVRK